MAEIKKEYNCDECGASFPRRRGNLRRHISRVHLKVKDHRCDSCTYSAYSKPELEMHKKSVHLKIKNFVCNGCPKMFSQSRYLRRHQNTVHLRAKNKISGNICDSCGIRFITINDLTQHKESHHQRGGIWVEVVDAGCDMCEKRFANLDQLTQHKNIDHRTNNISDEYGSSLNEEVDVEYADLDHRSRLIQADNKKKLSQVGNIENHDMRAQPSLKKKHRCNMCDMIFSRKVNVERHKINVHLKIKGFICDKCQKKFSEKGNLKRHKKKGTCKAEDHQKKKAKYICDLCNVTFSIKADLKMHKRNHLKAKEHTGKKCKPIGKKGKPLLSQVGNLKSHEMSAQQSFKNEHSCNLCDMIFSRKENMKRHEMNVHLNIRSFICDICKRKFSEKGNLKQHKNRGTCQTKNNLKIIDKEHICDVCNTAHSSKSNLTKHRRNVHKIANYQTCDDCGMNFLEIDMQPHKRLIHPRDKSCDECKECFSNDIDLIQHKLSAHPKDHICDILCP